MKYYLIITIITLLLIIGGCNKETRESTVYKTIYVNSSDHIIKIKNLAFKILEIPSGENFQESRDVMGMDGNEYPVNLRMDTVEVIYNDTLTIKHPGSFYSLKQDIRNPKNYTNVKEEHDYGVTYTNTYTFTNEDFREADSIIN